MPALAGDVSRFIEDVERVVTEGRATIQMEIDNDSLLLRRDDGFYSSGLRFGSQYALRDGDQIRIFGWRLGQELYTASDIKKTPAQVGPPDHPYAGWLYAGVFRKEQLATGAARLVGIDFGCLGPCAGGEQAQTSLHRWLNQPLPQGWRRQTRQEYGVVLQGEILTSRRRLGTFVDVGASLHGRFGNIFTDAGTGVMLRFGQIDQEWPQPALVSFFRLDGRVIAYNAALQGGYFSSDNPHTVKPERLVGEAEVGVAWSMPPFALRISVVSYSNTIQGLPDSVGNRSFASLRFSWTP